MYCPNCGSDRIVSEFHYFECVDCSWDNYNWLNIGESKTISPTKRIIRIADPLGRGRYLLQEEVKRSGVYYPFLVQIH